jgi:hypothetical protein
MRVDADQLGIGMTLLHHFANRLLLMFAHVHQDQIFAGGNIVVESLQLFVLGADAGQSAGPGAI